MYIVKFRQDGKEKVIIGDFSIAHWGDEVKVSNENESVVIKKVISLIQKNMRNGINSNQQRLQCNVLHMWLLDRNHRAVK